MFRDPIEKPDIATHYAEMGNLLSLNPKIYRLLAHAKKFGCLPNCQRIFVFPRRSVPVGRNDCVVAHGISLGLWLASATSGLCAPARPCNSTWAFATVWRA